MGKDKLNIAIVGTRGAVGQEMRAILEERKFPVGRIRFFGSARADVKEVSFQGKLYPIEELTYTEKDFKDVDIVLSSPGGTVSKKFAPHAVKAGAVVIDNTSAFRMDPKVPLVVPEINPEDISKHQGIIANPNCSTIIMLVAVAPLREMSKLRRIVCATYQSASGAGAKAMKELETQSGEYLSGKPLTKEAFPHQIAFNVFSHNSAVSADGYNEEERKVIQESKKILHDDKIRIGITCVRVPVFRAHSQAIFVEFEKAVTHKEAREILEKAPGVKIVDEAARNYFPMPIEASGADDVLVGRIRKDESSDNGLALFVSGDQLRKGAALNAIQIAEAIVRQSLTSKPL